MSVIKRTGFRGARAALTAVGLIAVIGVSPASASLVINGGTAGTGVSAPGNDIVTSFFGGVTQVGFFGATISQLGSATLTFTFIGHEASFIDTYLSPSIGPGIFNNQTSVLGDSFTTAGVNGLLSFIFRTNSGAGSVTNTVGAGGNGGLAQNAATPNFFASYLGSDIFLWLDDNGGTNDGDYDDLVLRISDVPLPLSFPLFATGLAGLVWLRKRRAGPLGLASNPTT